MIIQKSPKLLKVILNININKNLQKRYVTDIETKIDKKEKNYGK
jgi:hypothetical protein